MVLNDFQKPYNHHEIENEILENFKKENNNIKKNQDVEFSKKLLDKNENLLYQNEKIKFLRKYFKNSDNLNSEYFIITPQKPENTIYYFIGNLDNIFSHYSNIVKLSEETNSKILCLNYRGYGFSDGKLDLQTQLKDNQAFYEITKNEIKGSIWTFGYSLGSIYATYLGSDNKFDKIVLSAPFSNSKDAFKYFKKQNTKGIKRIAYPFVKLTADDYLLNISNTKKLENFRGNLIITHAKDDNILPFEMSENLIKNCKCANKKLIEIKHGSHGAPINTENWKKLLEVLK
jgi:alpha-beta hydrolase superfamily lysophospholipase